MRLTWEYFVAAAVLIIILLLVWFVGPMTTMKGSDLLILRMGILLLGLLGIAGFLWWASSNKPAAPRMQAPGVTGPSISAPSISAAGIYAPTVTAPSVGGVTVAAPQVRYAGPAGGGEDVDGLVREAGARLAASRLGRGATLGGLPAIFLLGESGSAKTTVVVNGGLDPELLAGQVYPAGGAAREGGVSPTPLANLWLARKTVFVEAGGRLLADPPRWVQLVKRMAPRKLSSVVGKGEQAPRAAVVCFNCEDFLKPNAGDAVAAAGRELRSRLLEISQTLGISFPVYVLFTRADSVPFFAEYVRGLNNEETTQVLGATLPFLVGQTTGVYAEQEAKRLTTVYNNLFHSLCDWRLPILSREHDITQLPGEYEFPREFRKLRTLAVQFLVDLCRPSQLRTAPFLRGFYFAGQRQVTMSTAPSQTIIAPTEGFRTTQPAAPASATRILRKEDLKAMLAAEAAGPQAQAGEARAMTQSVFLTHFLSHVVLQDQGALGASGASTRVSGLQRVLLAIAAVIALFLCLGFTVSYFGNRSLVSQVMEAARNVPATPVPAGELAQVDALKRLDTLRQALETLGTYEREGAPWRLRWGLYAGSGMYPDARKAYFNRFNELLFLRTQEALHIALNQLPASPAPTDEYGPTYDALKAYLITTSNPDKSTREFLSPVLLRTWTSGREVDEERKQLAQKQFDFYADELKIANPYSSANDTGAIAKARQYLTQFAATQRIYTAMRADASKKNAAFNFSRKYPEAAGVVSNNVEVEGAMTKAGWAFMQDAFKKPEKYFGGEEWVLGSQAAAGVDLAKLGDELRGLYLADYIRQWREVVTRTAVARYSSVQDAAAKLLTLSGNRSPLLALICEVSQNTSVDSPDVQKAFQPVQQVVPAACQEQYVQPPNQPYVAALLNLQSCLEQVATALPSTPPDQKDATKGQCIPGAGQAKVATRQIAQNFKIDQEAHIEKTVQKLMEDPITSAEGMLQPSGPAGAEGLCSGLRSLMVKYPFNPNGTQRATLDEVSAIFAPGTGALSTFYEQTLKNFFIQQGPRYVPNPATVSKLNPAFVSFFERAAGVQQAIYPSGAPMPQFRFALRPSASEGIQNLTLTINGQTQRSGGGSGQPMNFVWPGTAQGVSLTAKIQGGSELTFLSYDGLWALFQFIGDADRWMPAVSGYRMEWTLKISGQPVRLPNGQPVKVTFDVDTGGAPPIFQRGYFSNFTCVSRVAR